MSLWKVCGGQFTPWMVSQGYIHVNYPEDQIPTKIIANHRARARKTYRSIDYRTESDESGLSIYVWQGAQWRLLIKLKRM